MQTFIILFSIYLFVLLFSSIVSIASVNHVTKAMRVLVFLLPLTLISESISFIMRLNRHNPNLVVQIFNPIELFLFIVFFFWVNKVPRMKVTLVFSGGVSLFVELLDVVFMQSKNGFNSNFELFASTVLSSIGMFTMFRLLKSDDFLLTISFLDFWATAFVLFFWCGTFFFWGFFQTNFYQHWE